MTYINVDNVEETIEEAIDTYFKKSMFADGMFWRTCINLLREKYKK